MEKEDLQQLINHELAGKNAAIHAYDKMMWTVRTGFLTLTFAGWGLLIKAAVENNRSIQEIDAFIIMLAVTTLVIAISAFLIDRNYARRKFRVIAAANELVSVWLSTDDGKVDLASESKFVSLLQISGDAANKAYECAAYNNELFVGRVIYLFPCLMVILLILILIFS
jgi:hypothetical protein